MFISMWGSFKAVSDLWCSYALACIIIRVQPSGPAIIIIMHGFISFPLVFIIKCVLSVSVWL